MAEFALFVLVLVGSFVGMVVLWRLIENETENPPRMGRSEAERVARADADGDGADSTDDTDDGANPR